MLAKWSANVPSTPVWVGILLTMELFPCPDISFIWFTVRKDKKIKRPILTRLLRRCTSVANSFLSHTKMKTSLFSSFPNFLLMKKLKNAPETKKDTRFFLDTKWDKEQHQILSQIPKSFADIKSSISDTKMATLPHAFLGIYLR